MTEDAATASENHAEELFSAQAVATAKALANSFLRNLDTDDMKAEKYPRKLYHYTNMVGFKSIIETKTFWATDARYLNDSQELRYGERIIHEQLAAAIDRHDDPGIKSLLENTQRSYSKLEFGISIYSLSFSECEDDLSQWRGYGSGVGGIALQMDMRPFACEHCGGSMMKVIYDRDHQDNLINSIIDNIIILYGRLKVHCSELLASVECSIAFRIAVFPLILKFKSSYFSAEKEWRLIVVNYSREPIKNLEHRLSSGMLVPYLALPLKFKKYYQDGQLSIEDVMIGPSLNSDAIRLSVSEFMDHHGYMLMDGPTVSKVSLR